MSKTKNLLTNHRKKLHLLAAKIGQILSKYEKKMIMTKKKFNRLSAKICQNMRKKCGFRRSRRPIPGISSPKQVFT